MTTQERPLIGVKEIAGYIYRSKRTAERLLGTPGFPARKVGGIWEATAEELDAWRRSKEIVYGSKDLRVQRSSLKELRDQVAELEIRIREYAEKMPLD